ncbi:hypothetical protein U9M48_011809, partial [Paspalum notatum var. saurae]
SAGASEVADGPPRRLLPRRPPSSSPPPAPVTLPVASSRCLRGRRLQGRLRPRRLPSPSPSPAPAALPVASARAGRPPSQSSRSRVIEIHKIETKQGPYSDTRRRKSLRLIASSTAPQTAESPNSEEENNKTPLPLPAAKP